MKKGIYWKRASDPQVFWCESSEKIEEKVKFTNVNDYRKHRKSNGYSEGWDEIHIKELEVKKEEVKPKEEVKKREEEKNSKSKNGIYWKRENQPEVFWCQSYENISEEVSFKSVQEYKQHRLKNGYDQTWNHIYVKLEEENKEKIEVVEEECEEKNKNTKRFDRIYIVHLNRLTDRKINIIKHLKDLYNVVIIDAVDKNNFTIEELEDGEIFYTKDNLFCKDKMYCWCNGGGHSDMKIPGRIACALSHGKIYDDMISNNVESALVLEDDFELIRNINYLRLIEKKLPDDYDYIYFSHSRIISYCREYEYYNEYFVKLKKGWKETINYALTLETAKKLKKYLLPIRGAADGYITQHIEYLKTLKNVYLSRMDLVANLSMQSGADGMDSTIDIDIKKEIEDKEREKLNIELTKYSLSFEENKRKDRMLIITGYWKIKNKYKTDETYKEWMKNTLKIKNDICVFYDGDEEFEMINDLRKTSYYKTYFIRRPLDKFYVCKYGLDNINPSHFSVPSIELGKVYMEKMHMIKIASKLYNLYEWYSWMDIGNPIYRNGIKESVLLNYDVLDKTRMNCNHTHFGYKKEILNEFKNNKYNSYYHNISGSAFIFHNSIVDKYEKLFYDQLDLVSKLKETINASLIIDDQCVWTEIYGKDENLFKIIGGKYGEIMNTISVDAIEYNIKGTGQLGNQILHLIYELYANIDMRKDVMINFIEYVFKKKRFKLELYGNMNRYIRTYIFKDNKQLDGRKVKDFVNEKLIPYVNYGINGVYWKLKGSEDVRWSRTLLNLEDRIEFINKEDLMEHRKLTGFMNKEVIKMEDIYEVEEEEGNNIEIFDTLIHIRTMYSNPDENYYLQPNMVFYDYIFKNLDLGEKIGIVYGSPKNPIVDELIDKYKIKYVMSSTRENDLLTLTNCKNLVWSTSTMCWASYLLSTSVERNIVFDDIKRFFRTGVFFDDETYCYVKSKKEVKKSLLKDLKMEDLYVDE